MRAPTEACADGELFCSSVKMKAPTCLSIAALIAGRSARFRPAALLRRISGLQMVPPCGRVAVIPNRTSACGVALDPATGLSCTDALHQRSAPETAKIGASNPATVVTDQALLWREGFAQ